MAKEPTQGQQTAEDLISGLVTRCNHCTQARVDANEFYKRNPGVVLMGYTPQAGGPHPQAKPAVPIQGPFNVQCEQCDSSGLVLTDQGRKFLDLITTHMPRLARQGEVRPDRPARAS